MLGYISKKTCHSLELDFFGVKSKPHCVKVMKLQQL